MSKKVALVLVAAVLLVTAVAGGYLLGRTTAGTDGAPRGAFAQLTEAERQQLQTMTDEERTAFFKEKGIDMPAGGPGGPMVAGQDGATPGGGRGTRLLDGKVLSVDDDSVTVELAGGGSTKVYLSTDTVQAAAEGAVYKLEAGAEVLVFAEPEADGVTVARAVIVK